MAGESGTATEDTGETAVTAGGPTACRPGPARRATGHRARRRGPPSARGRSPDPGGLPEGGAVAPGPVTARAFSLPVDGPWMVPPRVCAAVQEKRKAFFTR